MAPYMRRETSMVSRSTCSSASAKYGGKTKSDWSDDYLSRISASIADNSGVTVISRTDIDSSFSRCVSSVK